MNYRELKKANVGDRVAFKPLPGDAGEYAEGTITGFSPSKHKCTVEWSDGETSTVTDASYDRIHLLPPAGTAAFDEFHFKPADLSQATAATVNDLRKAFAAKKLQGDQPTERRTPPRGGRD
jgi:nucleoid-associated protein YgaU